MVWKRCIRVEHSSSPTYTALPHLSERQRALGAKPSLRTLKGSNQENISNTSTTTNAQFLRMKRSMSNISCTPASSPAKQPRPPSRSSAGRPPSSTSQSRPPSSGGTGRPPSSSGRPPSRSSAGRPASRNESSRSKASGDRMDIGAGRKPSVPFLPAGSSEKQSQHI